MAKKAKAKKVKKEKSTIGQFVAMHSDCGVVSQLSAVSNKTHSTAKAAQAEASALYTKFANEGYGDEPKMMAVVQIVAVGKAPKDLVWQP